MLLKTVDDDYASIFKREEVLCLFVKYTSFRLSQRLEKCSAPLECPSDAWTTTTLLDSFNTPHCVVAPKWCTVCSTPQRGTIGNWVVGFLSNLVLGWHKNEMENFGILCCAFSFLIIEFNVSGEEWIFERFIFIVKINKMHLFEVFFMVGLFVEWFAFNEIRTNCAL